MDQAQLPRYLFVGNPGTGKTTMINLLAQAVKGKASAACGQGITSNLDWYNTSGPKAHIEAYVGDTPGLDDVALREQAAKSIEAGLKADGNYHLVFFCAVQQGRVRGMDVATVHLVLQALKSIEGIRYSIIFNMIDPRMMTTLGDAQKCLEFKSAFFSGISSVTDSVYFFQKMDALDYQEDVVVEPPASVIEFLKRAPSCVIPRDDVGHVEFSRYDELSTKIEKLVNDLSKSELRRAEEVENFRSREIALNNALMQAREAIAAANAARDQALRTSVSEPSQSYYYYSATPSRRRRNAEKSTKSSKSHRHPQRKRR